MEFEEEKQVDITAAIIAHLSLVGWIIAVIINVNKVDRDKLFGAFYIRQMLGLMFLALFAGLADKILELILGLIPFVGPMLYWMIILTLYLGLFGFWILSLISVTNYEKKELPIIGRSIQKVFGNAFE
jgi:uncharacterized membrane protein